MAFVKGEVALPLRCPPLQLAPSRVYRAGLRALVPDGGRVSAGEPFAYCQVRVLRDTNQGNYLDRSEARDCQLVFASRLSGRVHYERPAGGWQSYFARKQIDWEEPLATIVTDEPAAPDQRARIMWIAGRRPTEVAEQLSGLMSGWHDRVRAWWGDEGSPTETVLSHGSCDLLGVIRGEQRAFLELFQGCTGPAHVADYDDIVLPSSLVLLSQLERSDEDCRTIAEDLTRGVEKIAREGPGHGVGSEALFLAAVLQQLTRPCPLLEGHWIVGPGGVSELPPARAVILSGGSEVAAHLRHKRLGYVVSFPSFRIGEMTPATKGWFRETFEPVQRTVDGIEADLRRLAEHLRALTRGEIVVLNYVADSASLRDADLMMMLSGLAEQGAIRVVDVDAVVADLGRDAHIADRAHADAELQREVRSLLLWTLRDMGLPGFTESPR
jgi:hypothetical protein